MKYQIPILVLYFIACSLILMLPAWINGYPLVYSDTSTYLASGFELETPFDRPISYGLFVRIASLNGISLWLVIACQCILISYLILRITQFSLRAYEKSIWLALIFVVTLSACSSLSWTVCQIMPDIFTAIMCMSLFLLLFAKIPDKERNFLYLLFTLSCSMHMSHIVFLLCLLGFSLCSSKLKIFGPEIHIRNITIILILILTLASIVTMGSALAKSRHVFFMGAMVEHGILKKYLDEHCATSNYRLCFYKDSLPEKAWQFIWEPGSPFYKTGAWKDSKKEYNEIIYGSLSEPAFIGMHIKKSLEACIEQLGLFKIGDGNKAYPNGTVLYERVVRYFPHEQKEYESSLQNNEGMLFVASWNTLLRIVLLHALACSAFLLLTPVKNLTSPFSKVAHFWFLISILLNAWVCGTFANAIDRLGSKMIWLLPFSILLSLASAIIEKSESKDLNRKQHPS